MSGNPGFTNDTNDSNWSPSNKVVRITNDSLNPQDFNYDTSVYGNNYPTPMKYEKGLVYTFIANNTNTILTFESQIPGAFGPVLDNVIINEDVDSDGFYSDNDCDDNNALINPNMIETCDGLDNNCSGQVDEGLTAPSATNQYGVCSGSVKVCNGKSGWGEPDLSSLPYYESTETRCDTLDNNCDGKVDEGGICEFSCLTPNPDKEYLNLGLGTNRWVYNGDKWITQYPKGGGKGPIFTPTLPMTHQCGCEQILTWLHDNLPESYGEMNGHWKYGCSQSAIQDFIKLAQLSSFSSKASLYYNGPTDASPIYGSGPIVFTWNPVTHQITGGYYTEQVPAYTGTTYYNMITGGTVVGNNVGLIFNRINPNIYNFNFDGTLIGNELSGMMDGPYLFTATGTVSP